MTDNTVRLGFPKLNDSNYIEWSIRMEAELIETGLWSMVDVEVETDGKDTAAIAAALAAKKSQRNAQKMAQARAKIILRVEDGQLAHMRDKDPMAIWGTLRRVHQAHGFATSLALRRRFLTTKKRDDESMQAWIGSIRRQTFLMQEAGDNVTAQDMILAVTMGLPSSYNAVIINFDSTPRDQLTFENVVARLINEETRQLTSDESVKTEPGDEALAAINRHTGRDVICHFCERPGHMKGSCRERQRWEEWKRGGTANIAHSRSFESDDECEHAF